jgi:5'(3')-deoxyribonucleotidase
MKYYIDMDEVIVDLNTSVFAFYGISPTIGEWEQVPNRTPEQILDDIDCFEFWRDLPKMPWADELIELVNSTSDKWIFLSCPTPNPESWAGKAAWIKIHFPQYLSRLTLVRDKWRIASHQSCLIDDRKHHIDLFAKNGGHTIPFPSKNGQFPWSEEQMKNPVDYVRKCINRVETARIVKQH